MIKHRNKDLHHLLLAAAAVLPAAAPAQQTSGGQELRPAANDALTEIVVTARKREESLQEVPLSITAFGSAEIQRMGARNLEDLAYRTPGLQFNSQALAEPGRSFTRVRFRGMDLNTTPNPTSEIASVFMDGVYLPGSVSSLPVDDLERVEVIRGPQSALFGRATFGGAVNFVTRDPGDEFGGRLRMSAAEDSDYEISGSIEGPLVAERLAFRLGARYYDFGGQYTSGADGRPMGEQSTRSVHGTLVATPTENLTARLNLRYFEDDDGPPAGYFLGGTDRNCGPFRFPGITGPAFGTTAFFCGNLPKVSLESRGPYSTLTPDMKSIFIDNSRNYAPINGMPKLEGVGLARESTFGSLAVSYTLSSGASISATAGYSEEKTSNFRDWDVSPTYGWYASGPQRNRSSTQELRVESGTDSRLTWLVGASSFRHKYSTPDAGGLFVLFQPPAAPFVAQNPVATNEAETIGLFAAAGYEISDRVKLNLEARYQEDEITQRSTAANAPVLTAKYETVLPRVILEFQPFERTNLYATYSIGNRPGGFNPELVSATQSVRDQIRQLTGAGVDIEEEDLDNYELGWKQGFADGRGYLNLAGYYMNWTNQQTRFAIPVVDPGNPASDPVSGVRVVQVTVNAGQTDLWGVEAEGSFQLTPSFVLSGNFAWAATEYQEFLCLFCARYSGDADVAGNSVPRFPEFSGGLSGTYTREFGSGLVGTLRTDVLYFGEAYVEESNLATTAAYTLVNLRAGLERANWRLELFARNLFDDDNYLAASRNTDFRNGFNFSQQGVVVTPAKKRQFGLRVEWSF